MKTNRSRESSYNVKPVIRVELSKKHLILRIVLLVVLLITGLVFIGIGINQCLSKNKGLAEITSNYTGLNSGNDFHFYYDLGRSGTDPTAENKILHTVYDDATGRAYQIFDEHSESKEYNNLNYINNHPNTDVIVPNELYKALKKISDFNEKYLYLAPVYEEYVSLAYCNYDNEASNLDPNINTEQKKFVEKINDYISDNNHIKLIFKENNVVNLKVSIEYITYLSSVEKKNYISLNFFKNAFILDYFYDIFVGRGYHNGFIYSVDGYYRSLGLENNFYNIYDYLDKDLFVIGKMEMINPLTLVNYRNFNVDKDYCGYQYSSGDFTSTLTNPDGINLHNCKSIIGYSATSSCSSLALLLSYAYTKDNLNELDLQELKNNNIYTIYLKDNILTSNDDNLNLTALFDNGTLKYEWKKNNEKD